jgi:uncharacterized protein YjdB
MIALMGTLACESPAKIVIEPVEVVLEKKGQTAMLEAVVLNGDGEKMSIRGLEINWFNDDKDVIRITHDGQVTALASGKAEVKATLEEGILSDTASVEVRIPEGIRVSKDKLRLTVGQTVEDVWAEVITSRGAFVEGLLPTFWSEDDKVVKVEAVIGGTRRQTFAKLTGVSPGTARIVVRHEGLSSSIRVSVFDEEDDVIMVGDRISKKKMRDARRASKNKKHKPRKIEF